MLRRTLDKNKTNQIPQKKGKTSGEELYACYYFLRKRNSTTMTLLLMQVIGHKT
jgi:hypothetical protein